MMYKHALFFDMICDVEDAEAWIESNLEDAAYSSLSNDGETGTIEYCFYTSETLASQEQRTLVAATSPKSYTFNSEE